MRARDVCPLTEYRRDLTGHFRRLKKSGRPLFVTVNGKTAAVVLSPAAYDALADKAELAFNLDKIERDTGNLTEALVRNARKSIREIAQRHGEKVDP